MPFSVTETALPEVLLLQPKVFEDPRGYFFESFNQRAFQETTGLVTQFVQDNQSRSARGVLRGLHYQLRQPQAKLIRVLSGAIFDVAVDLRRSSPHFGQWVGFTLTATEYQQAFIPEGFAHGFLVLSDFAEILYKTSDYWDPTSERTLRWDDPLVGINWPLDGEPILAAKDLAGTGWDKLETFD